MYLAATVWVLGSNPGEDSWASESECGENVCKNSSLTSSQAHSQNLDFLFGVQLKWLRFLVEMLSILKLSLNRLI